MDIDPRQIIAADRHDRAGMQFGTRTMLASTTVCAGLVALSQASPLWAAIVGWLVVLAAAHVAANVRGSRLRVEPKPRAESMQGASQASERAESRAVHFAPLTRLRDSRQPGKLLLAAAASGAMLGSCLATTALAIHSPTTIAGTMLGGVSGAVLGGFLGFLAGSCLGASARAFHEATREH